jgi:hypothetical protein
MPIREFEEHISISFEGASAAIPGLMQGVQTALRAPIQIRLENLKNASLPALNRQQLPSLPRRSTTNGRQIGRHY